MHLNTVRVNNVSSAHFVLLDSNFQLISVMYQFFSSSGASAQRETDQALHSALRNAESLLTESFYGGMHVLASKFPTFAPHCFGYRSRNGKRFTFIEFYGNPQTHDA